MLDILHSRYKLYKHYYHNRIWQGLEIMLCEIFDKIKTKYDIKAICQNIDRDYYSYCELTDTIIFEVLRSKNDELKEARNLITQIQTRKLYHYVAETDDLRKQSALM